MNSENVLNFTQLPPEWQILKMLSSFTTLVLSDNVRLLSFRSVLWQVYRMW